MQWYTKDSFIFIFFYWKKSWVKALLSMYKLISKVVEKYLFESFSSTTIFFLLIFLMNNRKKFSFISIYIFTYIFFLYKCNINIIFSAVQKSSSGKNSCNDTRLPYFNVKKLDPNKMNIFHQNWMINLHFV